MVAEEDLYFEDLEITPEVAANLEELVESGAHWIRGDSVVKFVSADHEVVRRLMAKYTKNRSQDTDGTQAQDE